MARGIQPLELAAQLREPAALARGIRLRQAAGPSGRAAEAAAGPRSRRRARAIPRARRPTSSPRRRAGPGCRRKAEAATSGRWAESRSAIRSRSTACTQSKELRRFARLVGLQRADEVAAEAAVRERPEMRARFLQVILAEVGKARVQCRADALERLRLATPISVTRAGSRPAAIAASVMRCRTAASLSAGFCGAVNILVCGGRGYTAPGPEAPLLRATGPCVVHRARES